MKKKLTYVIFTILLSFLFVLTLQLLQWSKESNGFQRTIKDKSFQLTKIIKLPSNDCYFAGISSTEIYLKDIGDLKRLFSLDHSLKGLKELDLRLNGDSNFYNRKLNIGVIDKVTYVTNRFGNLSTISNGIKRDFKNAGIRFDQSHMLSTESMAVRQTILLGSQLRRKLTKYDYIRDTIEKSILLEKQIDGFFCTDGLLKYDPESSRLFYLYFYRGSYLCLDTNLNLLYQGKTIDTLKTAKMEMAALNKQYGKNKNLQLTTQLTPPKKVNHNYTLHRGNVYIVSALRADNEKWQDFKNNQVVDVYSMTEGNYLDSFYVPRYKGLRPRELRFSGKLMFAIYDGYIARYQIE